MTKTKGLVIIAVLILIAIAIMKRYLVETVTSTIEYRPPGWTPETGGSAL